MITLTVKSQVRHFICTGSHSNVGIKNQDFLELFSTRHPKKSEPTLVSFWASNNKVDSNNCNILAQNGDEHTRNTNFSTCSCKYTYKISLLVIATDVLLFQDHCDQKSVLFQDQCPNSGLFRA